MSVECSENHAGGRYECRDSGNYPFSFAGLQMTCIGNDFMFYKACIYCIMPILAINAINANIFMKLLEIYDIYFFF